MIVYIQNIEFKYVEITKRGDTHPKRLATKLLIYYDVAINHNNKITGLKIMDFPDLIDLAKIKTEILIDLKKDL